MLVDPLRRHVVGRSDERVRHRRLGAEEPAQAEVPELDDPLRRDEDVGRLDVCQTTFLSPNLCLLSLFLPKAAK